MILSPTREDTLSDMVRSSLLLVKMPIPHWKNIETYFLTDGKSSSSICLIRCYCFFKIMQGINAEPLTLFMELLYSGINDAIKKEGLSYELLLSFW